jgi:hypothetical protein
MRRSHLPEQPPRATVPQGLVTEARHGKEALGGLSGLRRLTL